MLDALKEFMWKIVSNVTYVVVRTYSECEFYYKHYVKPYMPLSCKEETYEFVKNGVIQETMSDIREVDNDIDFVLHTTQIGDVVYGSVLRGKCVPRVVSPVANMSMTIEISAASYVYEIKLADTMNYFVEGNELLFPSFIQWYLNITYGVSIDVDENYTIVLVDKDLNIISMSRNDYLLVNQTGYKIINSTELSPTSNDKRQ